MKVLSVLAKVVAFFLALLLVLALPLALLAYDVGRVVFNPPLVKAALTDEVLNSDLLPIVLEWYSERRAQERVDRGEALVGVNEPDVPLLLSFLDRRAWKQIKAEVLTDPILTGWTAVTVDGFYAWIDSEDRVPQIAWDMASFKDQVNSEHGVKAITIAYESLPECELAQVRDFEARMAAAAPRKVLYNLCNFSGYFGADNFDYGADQFGQYVDALGSVVENIPDEFDLTEEVSNLAEREGVGPEAIKLQLRWIRLMMNLAWLVPLILFVLILVLAVRTVKGLGRWLGLPLVGGGALLLLPALVYRLVISRLLSAGPLSEVPEVVGEEAIRISLRLAEEIFRPMLYQSLVILVIGLALVVIMLLKKERR